MAELKIKADSGGGTVSFKGPATTTDDAAVQLTLPVDDGAADQYLKTNGSGVLSWATVTDTNTFGPGRILKSEQYNNTGRTNIPDDSWVGCGSQTITPTASTSKILVLVSMPYGLDSSNAEVNYILANFRLMWNHSGISETQLQHKRHSLQLPEDTGTDMILMGSCEIMFLHTHGTTNEITYEVQGKLAQSSSHLEVISGGSGTDNKTITLLEIGA